MLKNKNFLAKFLFTNQNQNNRKILYNKLFVSKSFTDAIILNEDVKLGKIKNDMRKMALTYVNKYGFTENNLKIVANELGYSHMISGVFPNGPADLIYSLMDDWNDKLKKEIEKIKKEENLTEDEKIKKALKLRLCYIIPVINSWPQAINLGMQPENIYTTVTKISETIDLILSIKDDKYYDLSRSKLESNSPVPSMQKWLLTKIYLLSELHMLTDKSFNYEHTWKLLDSLYSFNMNFYEHFSNVSLVLGSALNLVKYSLEGLLPYDLSKIEEILGMQSKINQNNDMNKEDSDNSNKDDEFRL